MLLWKAWIYFCFSSSYGQIVEWIVLDSLVTATDLEKEKLWIHTSATPLKKDRYVAA